MLSFEDFAESKQRPNLVPIDPSTVSYKSISEMKLMTEAAVTSGDFVQVCDGMKWICTSTGTGGRISYLSSDGEFVYSFTARRNAVLSYVLNPDNKLELIANDRLQFAEPDSAQYNIKEESNMANETKSIEDLINDVAPAAPSANAPMTAFNSDAPQTSESKDDAVSDKAKEKKLREETLNRIRSEARNSGAADDISVLKDVWNRSAQHLVWITPNDARDTIAAVKQSVPADQRQLVNGAPEAVKQQFLKGPATVDPQYIQQVYKIEAKRSKPGKPVGAVIRMPAYLKGKSVQEFTQAIALQGPKAETDALSAVELLPISDYEQKLTLVGGSIMEAPETHGGNPSEIKINYSIAKAKSGNTGSGLAVNLGTVLTKKFVRVGNGNKTVLTNDNYFPLTTYETHDIYAPMDKEVIAQLNVACFESIFGGGKQSLGKYRSLSAAEQANITKDGDKISSNYITNDANLIRLNVKEFFDKSADRDTIRIPMKVRKTKADGKLSALSFVKYSVTADEKKINDPEYFKMTSLGDGRFENIIALCGTEILNPAKLRETFKRGGGGGDAKSLDSITARSLLKAKILGTGFGDYTVEGLELEA